MSAFTIVWVAIVFVGLSALSYFAIPKNWDQTLWRTCLIMTFFCIYLMWAITYLAQLHPLISPRRSNLRPEH
ncbi:H(+)-transporting V0 sector ATPase subunit e [Tieghemiomyces parasiticus]|uniref:H(+)-transporting V0 sector ATPase subunit e n=1 Tax=Tieghemiomyces parasiticus TaxID=78921 RepID=A0A9W7ZRX9_9FUNG|nr:H(+)-transporting V0 sector ATPase subunit e [Tieghemiomyces parasiticus]